MLNAMDISTSALTAQRVRMDVIAGNMANAFSTHQEDGTIEPYRRRIVAVGSRHIEGAGTGVAVDGVYSDPSPFPERYEPYHADAIPDGPRAGYVRYPNVNLTMEYVDMMLASRAYEANLAMLNVSRNMVQQAVRLFA
jgi:flagellar basal-body rod protein FlgC